MFQRTSKYPSYTIFYIKFVVYQCIFHFQFHRPISLLTQVFIHYRHLKACQCFNILKCIAPLSSHPFFVRFIIKSIATASFYRSRYSNPVQFMPQEDNKHRRWLILFFCVIIFMTFGFSHIV